MPNGAPENPRPRPDPHSAAPAECGRKSSDVAVRTRFVSALCQPGKIRSIRAWQHAGMSIEEPESMPESIRILIVDDDPALRRLIGDFLRGHGYDVFEADGGHQMR